MASVSYLYQSPEILFGHHPRDLSKRNRTGGPLASNACPGYSGGTDDYIEFNEVQEEVEINYSSES
jgi:hypothetical protein